MIISLNYFLPPFNSDDLGPPMKEPPKSIVPKLVSLYMSAQLKYPEAIRVTTTGVRIPGSILIQPPCRTLSNFVNPILACPSNPHWLAWKGKLTTPAYKAMAPVPIGTERVVQGVLTAKYLWVKKSHRKRVSRLKITTYNVRTPLRDERI